MTALPYIDAKEFKDFGYLQEVNRQFLHPLGMALATYTLKDDTPSGEFLEQCVAAAAGAICVADAGHAIGARLDETARAAATAVLKLVYPEGAFAFAGVVDHRDDPEGIYFDVDEDGRDDFLAKAGRVADEQLRRREPREGALGYVVQPVVKAVGP